LEVTSDDIKNYIRKGRPIPNSKPFAGLTPLAEYTVAVDDAARAMLAALKAIDEALDDNNSFRAHQYARAAIAQAEAAGIKAG